MLVPQVTLAPEDALHEAEERGLARDLGGAPPRARADAPAHDADSDAGIIADCLSGKPERFGELVARYAGYVASFALWRTRNRADAEEIAQETMVRAFENLARLRAPRRFSAWLIGIADHIVADCIEKRGRSVSLDAALGGAEGASRLHPEGVAPGPLDAARSSEEQGRLLEAIGGLPERYRTVLVLKHQRDMGCEEIGRSLGLATSTVTSRLSRAYAMLRQRLGESRGPE
jgi:RNA polymerase sigma-70 factor (ECF subfamily)